MEKIFIPECNELCGTIRRASLAENFLKMQMLLVPFHPFSCSHFKRDKIATPLFSLTSSSSTASLLLLPMPLLRERGVNWGREREWERERKRQRTEKVLLESFSPRGEKILENMGIKNGIDLMDWRPWFTSDRIEREWDKVRVRERERERDVVVISKKFAMH